MPDRLLRFIEKEEYADQFISGQIRFGLLDYYKKIEGARQDEKEGQVSFFWDLKAPTVIIDSNTRQIIGHAESNQNISYRGSSINPYYIVSTSHPDVNKQLLAKKFGYFIVRINDPQALLERIKVAWQQHDWALNDHVVIVPTEYNKDEVLEPNEYLIPPHEYSYCQKPPSFSDEQEFRYVLVCRIDTKRTLNNHLTLNVGDCRDICTIVSGKK